MQIFSFGLGVPSTETTPEILGGKGAGLVWMDSQGVNVPPGFILPTTLWTEYSQNPAKFMENLEIEIAPWLQRMKDHFDYMPLVSVRSGARVSAPGMMDTILNVGIDGETLPFWVKKLGKTCAANSECRLIEMYASVVKGMDKSLFKRCKTPTDFHDVYESHAGGLFPDFAGQLLGSIEAVFKSWNNERCKFYRKMNNMPDEWGTACTVQAMVFGNLNDQSGTGVLFTRNPDTGEDGVVGEFAINAQGEDVVDGSTTPIKLPKMVDWNPTVAQELLDVAQNLEKLKGDVQDMEFTIQDGKLYILQTRNAKRSPAAAVRIAAEMFEESLIDLATVYKRVSLQEFDKAQQVVLDPKFDKKTHADGISACSGVVTGVIVHSAEEAITCTEPCILVTQETTPDDIAGMFAAKGIVTMTGGSTCHAAVVARGMNKPCIVGVGLNLQTKFPKGKKLSIDGSTGRMWMGEVPVIDGSKNEAAAKYMAMLRKALNYVPIVDSVPAQFSKEYLYHLSPSHLNLPDDMAVLDGILKQCDTLYIDLRPERKDECETTFYELFTPESHSYEIEVQVMWKGLNKKLKDKIVLLGGDTKLSGMKVVPKIDDLESLVLADGLAIMGKLDVLNSAVCRVLEWHAKDIDLLNYGKIAQGPVKSFVSDIMALQSR